MLGDVASRSPALLVVLLVMFAALAACGSAPAGTGGTAVARSTGVKLTRVGTFSSPVYVAQAPGDARRLFVVEQGGKVRVVRDGHVLPAPFLDLTRLVVSGGEQGLLSIAFAPDYATSGRFYVDYTDANGQHPCRRVPARLRAGPREPAQSARLVLFQRQPRAEPQRRAAAVRARRLSVHRRSATAARRATRTGGSATARTSATLLGKILRIDPRRTAATASPPSNPFVGRRRRRGRDLRLRPAQPVALLVRPRDRRPGRSATSARTRSRRSTSARRVRRAASTSAGACLRATRRRGPVAAHRTGDVKPVLRVHARRRRVLDHRRLRRARPAAAGARRPLRVRRLLRRRAC